MFLAVGAEDALVGPLVGAAGADERAAGSVCFGAEDGDSWRGSATGAEVEVCEMGFVRGLGAVVDMLGDDGIAFALTGDKLGVVG